MDYGNTQIPRAYYWHGRILCKEAGRPKSNTRQRLANHEVWNFFKLAEPKQKHPTKHPWPPNHRPPLTSPLSCSLTLLLQLFSASLINWSWNQAKSASYCPLYAHSSPQWKMAAFLRQLKWLVELWAADQSQKVTQITPGYSADNRGGEGEARTGYWKIQPILIFWR